MVLVAVLSALLLALASSLAARLLWEARERRELSKASDALAAAISREAGEQDASPAQAAAEAFRESTLPGYRAELWRGRELLVSTVPGETAASSGVVAAQGWIRNSRPLQGGLLLVLSEPPEHGKGALTVFAYSLALAAPACLLVAVLVSRVVARRATRPLIDLQERIAALRGLEPLPASHALDIPLEVSDLEVAFRDLWQRLGAMLHREGEFAANASHELRLPLTRIRLQAERALVDAGPTARAALAAQASEVDRLTKLLDSLLVLARDPSSALPAGETVNLADVCQRVAERSLLGSRATACCFPDEAFVRGDEALIEIAVENLFDNARKFAVGPSPIRAELRPVDHSFRLSVTTPGARIAAGDEDRLFDRFYRDPRARAQTEGHGLGLALARHVARLHGGDVRCESREAEDARFSLELPAWVAAPPPEG